jgi:hypothetical protein
MPFVHDRLQQGDPEGVRRLPHCVPETYWSPRRQAQPPARPRTKVSHYHGVGPREPRFHRNAGSLNPLWSPTATTGRDFVCQKSVRQHHGWDVFDSGTGAQFEALPRSPQKDPVDDIRHYSRWVALSAPLAPGVISRRQTCHFLLLLHRSFPHISCGIPSFDRHKTRTLS